MSRERYQYFVVVQKLTEDHNVEGDNKIFFSGLHNYLVSSIAKIVEDGSRSVDDIVQKGISGLRGMLSPYLSMPLTSDKNDIENGIREHFRRMMDQSGAVSSDAPFHIETFIVMESQDIPLHRQIVGVIRRLLKNGRTQLADTGVSFGKNFGSVYITQIVHEDLSAIPLLAASLNAIPTELNRSEYMFVSDGIGEIVYNGASERISSEYVMMLQWDGDDAMASALQKRFVVLAEQFGITNVVLAKKTLFSGFGFRYYLQCPIQLEKHAIGSIIVSLIGDDDVMEDAITTRGSLLVLQKISGT
jgi:hypothetical protein